MQVRRAVAADFEQWCDLFEAVAEERRWIGREPPIDRDERRIIFDRWLTEDSQQTFIADDDGQVVGTLGVELHRYGVAHLGMMISADRRGQGIGSALMEACVGWSRAAGAHKVALEVWPHNTAARALYEKFGFVEEGVLRSHYRRQNGELWDAVVMGLLL